MFAAICWKLVKQNSELYQIYTDAFRSLSLYNTKLLLLKIYQNSKLHEEDIY